MARLIVCLGFALAIVALVVRAGGSAEPQSVKTEKPGGSATPAGRSEKAAEGASGATSYKLKREPFKVEVSLRGTFEAEKMVEIAIRPQVWIALEVAKAAAHGQRVKEGDVLVQFDVEKIDDEIADLRVKQAVSQLAFQQAEENLKALEATAPLDLDATERAKKIAHEDYEKFVKQDRALMEKSADYSEKSARYMLDNQRDELRQLEKMYNADDLTEETEEIVLKRQRRDVEMAEFIAESAKANHDDALRLDIPRRQKLLEQNLRKIDIAAAKSKVSVPLALSQTRRDMERMKLERAKEDQRLKKLLGDRELLTVKAPIDGIVYYGRFTRGKWSGADAIADSLRAGGLVMKNSVVMTVVQSRPLLVRASVSESDLEKVRSGMKATATPTAYADQRLEATVDHVDTVPSAAESFDVRLGIKLEDKPEIVPGMVCSVKIASYFEKSALAIPGCAVFRDETDDRKTYVFVLDAGKPKRRDVVVGKKGDEKVEVVRGLSEGDEILLERPRDEKPKDEAKPQPKAAAEQAVGKPVEKEAAKASDKAEPSEEAKKAKEKKPSPEGEKKDRAKGKKKLPRKVVAVDFPPT